MAFCLSDTLRPWETGKRREMKGNPSWNWTSEIETIKGKSLLSLPTCPNNERPGEASGDSCLGRRQAAPVGPQQPHMRERTRRALGCGDGSVASMNTICICIIPSSWFPPNIASSPTHMHLARTPHYYELIIYSKQIASTLSTLLVLNNRADFRCPVESVELLTPWRYF